MEIGLCCWIKIHHVLVIYVSMEISSWMIIIIKILSFKPNLFGLEQVLSKPDKTQIHLMALSPLKFSATKMILEKSIHLKLLAISTLLSLENYIFMGKLLQPSGQD